MATYSLYIRQFGLKSRWLVLYLFGKMFPRFFSPVIFLYENWLAIFPLVTRTLLGENVGSRVSALETLSPRPNPIPMREHGSRFFETTNFFHFKGQEIGVCVLEEGTRYLDDVSPRLFAMSMVYRKDKADNCSRVKILEHSTVPSTSKIEKSILLGKWTRDLMIEISFPCEEVDLFASFTGYYSDIRMIRSKARVCAKSIECFER